MSPLVVYVCVCVCVCVCVMQVVEGLQAAGVGGPVFDEFTRAMRRVKGAAKLLASVPHITAMPQVAQEGQ